MITVERDTDGAFRRGVRMMLSAERGRQCWRNFCRRNPCWEYCCFCGADEEREQAALLSVIQGPRALRRLGDSVYALRSKIAFVMISAFALRAVKTNA